MDTALLARVSGTDPSLMGSEEIQQIMRTPDLLSIYQKLQEEDDRRQRRLERNRASARVRREKKKGMVETYEGEVAKLESSLNMLKNHEFGTGNAQELATALQNSSGEYLRHALMSKDAKMELMARILGQHSRNTEAIRRANAENQALIAVASDNSKLFLSLRAQLGLTNEQCQRIANFNASASEEARKLDVIRKCFSALRAHDWLYVPGIETILHQTRNTMTPHQFQKLLSWSVENRPSIDQLQFVSTPSVCEQDLTFIFSED
ncbi:unnamed protein product [Peronospora belbahrii]|nr:unnamed protein product [Peronospora belbahrii]